MAHFLESLLLAFTVVDLALAFVVIKGPNHKRVDNIFFVIYSVSGALWCFFFGQLIMQTGEYAAYIDRCLGLVGTFGSMIAVAFLVTSWANLPRAFEYLVRGISLTGIIVLPISCKRECMEMVMTEYGMTYRLTANVWNTIYNGYCYVTMVMLLLVIVHMLRGSNRKRNRYMGFMMLFELIVIALGSVFDTVLPMFGYAAIPGSTLAQFFGTLVIFHALTYSNNNTQNVRSVANRLFAASRVPILAYSEKGRLELASEEADRILNVKDKLNTFVSLNELFELENDPLKEIGDYAVLHTSVKGTDKKYELEINTLFDNFKDVSGYLVIGYETTERERFIEQLDAERNRADRANLAKTEFLANMSHEIRTPINTVLGMNEMIRRESDSSVIRGYSSNIKNAGEALLSLINDILDFSKVEAGKMEVVEVDYNLKKMLASLAGMFGLKSSEKGLVFTSDVDPELPTGLFGDEIRIRQVLMNLLSNAVKYTRSGSVTLKVSAAGRKEGRLLVRYEVRDTGIGIKKDEISKLFDDFSRFDLDKNRTIEGTGLGLSIVRKLADLMGGTLEVESEYGVGSTFTFELAQKVTDESAIGEVENWENYAEADSKPYHESFTAPEACVMVVDDNKMNLEVIKGLLKNTGIKLDLVSGGAECLEKVVKQKYDVILLDHMMPEMDGIETLKRFKAIPEEQNPSHSAKVVALTANALYGVREMYFEKGFDEYLSKPIEGPSLEECLMKLLPKELVTASNGSGEDGSAEEEPKDALNILRKNGIDTEQGLKYCADEELYKMTAEAFIAGAEEMKSNLRAYRERRDVSDYRVQIHAVKSNAKTLGCMWLFEKALEQENYCINDDFGPVVSAADEPEKMIDRLCGIFGDAWEFDTSDFMGE